MFRGGKVPHELWSSGKPSWWWLSHDVKAFDRFGGREVLGQGSFNTFKELLENHLLPPQRQIRHLLLYPLQLCCEDVTTLSLSPHSEFLAGGDFILLFICAEFLALQMYSVSTGWPELA